MKSILRAWHYFDWANLSIVLTLLSIGLLFIFSTTYTPAQPYSLFFKKQLIGIFSGMIIYIFCSLTDFRSLMRWGHLSYVLVLGLLLYTLFKGHIGMGAQRWINLYIIRMQPSELAKLLFPAYVAYYFFTDTLLCSSWHRILPITITLSTSFILILKQPDLGTALILLMIGLILLWCAGVPTRVFIICAGLLTLVSPIIYTHLKPYQKKRITVFFGAGTASNERYQTEQAKIAIGSGGLWGKGLLCGTQNRLAFVPERKTDFIFAIIAEEGGYLLAFLILVLYGTLFLRILNMIARLQSLSLQLLSLGIMLHILIAMMVNIFMVLGMLPIVGIPLPLLSYGISNLWITLASLGWLQGIRMHEYSQGRITQNG